MTVRHYSDLIAWQKSMDLVEDVYRQTDGFPKSELFGLVNQVRHASVSIPSNIAEGQGRATTKDFVHFLYIAKGSLQEAETQLLLSQRLGFLIKSQAKALLARSAEVARILNGLIASLQPHCG